MNLSWFRHQSDSRYCFSIDARRTKVRLAVAKDAPINSINLVYGDEFRFSDTRKSVPMEIRHEDLDFYYYEACMEADVPRFFYIFHISSNEGEFDFYESGLAAGFDYSLAFLSAFRHNGENRIDFVTPKKKFFGKVVYQIFPERFAIGQGGLVDKSYVDKPWGATGKALGHNSFLGGDLYGIIEHLDYLSTINVGAIYLTPIHPSPSNHKYDVIDYFDVDPRFGGKKALRELVKEAHARNIAIIMDLVFNHCSSKHPFFQDVKQNGKDSKYYSWFMIDGDKPNEAPLNYRTFAYVKSMPKFDTGNKEVQDYLIEVGRYWAKEFEIDGYRLDVSDAVSHYFWTRFKLALREIDEDFLLIGENWLNSESFLRPSELDGVMNYPFLAVTGSYILGLDDAAKTAMKLDGLLMRYKEGNNESMLNILASHDIQRLKNLVNGDEGRCLLGYAIMMFFVGMPMIYYGEEVFMEGGGDPDCRRGMAWDLVDNPSENSLFFRALLGLRADRHFREGELRSYGKDGLLVMERRCPDSTLTLYLNATKKPVELPLSGEKILARNYGMGLLGSNGILVIAK